MEEASERLEALEIWDEQVEEIAVTFEVPPNTAKSWKRNIGDLGKIEQCLGERGPENYLDLIQKREWLPIELEEKESEWVEPVKKWSVEKADDIFLVHKSERDEIRKENNYSRARYMALNSEWLAAEFSSTPRERSDSSENDGIYRSEEMLQLKEELNRKEKLVKNEMRRFDPEWIALVRELREIEQTLVEVYKQYIQDTDKDYQYKKDKIIEIKEAFPYLRANNQLVAKALKTSISYAGQFKKTPNGDITNRKITGNLRDSVFDRDDDSCVSCGSGDGLVIHHIIPHNQGGENKLDNLAILCQDCHYYAHGGGKPRDDEFHSSANWDSVEYSSQEEFWNEWLDQDFNDRPLKSQIGGNFEPSEE